MAREVSVRLPSLLSIIDVCDKKMIFFSMAVDSPHVSRSLMYPNFYYSELKFYIEAFPF